MTFLELVMVNWHCTCGCFKHAFAGRLRQPLHHHVNVRALKTQLDLVGGIGAAGLIGGRAAGVAARRESTARCLCRWNRISTEESYRNRRRRASEMPAAAEISRRTLRQCQRWQRQIRAPQPGSMFERSGPDRQAAPTRGFGLRAFGLLSDYGFRAFGFGIYGCLFSLVELFGSRLSPP